MKTIGTAILFLCVLSAGGADTGLAREALADEQSGIHSMWQLTEAMRGSENSLLPT